MMEMIEESELRRLIRHGLIKAARMVDATDGKYLLVFNAENKDSAGKKQVIEYGLAPKRSTEYRLFSEKAAIKWLRESDIREFSVSLNQFVAGQKGLF